MHRGILATRDELEALRGRIARKPFDAIYEALRKRCALILEAAPVAEPQWRSLWEHGRWASAVNAARTTQGRILDLLVAHHIDPNRAYRDRAIEELKNLIGWTTWVDPCHNHLTADLCTAEAAVAAAVGLDWLWEDLSEADRLRVLKAIRRRVVEPYCRAVSQQEWWYNCYHNWNAVVNSGCGLAALALSDEEPQAMQAYKLARQGLKRFFDALGREGGWDEGTGYWGLAARYVLLLAEAVSRLRDDQELYHARGMDATGLFPIYFTPHGQPASFGDAPVVPLYGTFYLLVKQYGLADVAWWLDTYAFHRDVQTTGWSAAGLAMLFRPIDAETPRVPDLAPVKVFHEIGWAAVADSWPRPGLYVSAKAGDLAAAHSQRDMNSLQVQVAGEMILTDLGHGPERREYYTDARSDFYEVQARAHNTITVAERDHLPDAQGSVLEADSGPRHRWVALDAGTACGENVRFVRHVVMTVDPARRTGRAVFVLDELDVGVPEKVELFWHTSGRVELDARNKSGTIAGTQSGLHFAIATTMKSSASTKSQRLDSSRGDNVVRVYGGCLGRAYLASVFSPHAPPGEVEIREDSGGGVQVTAADTTLRFRTSRSALRLEKVSPR